MASRSRSALRYVIVEDFAISNVSGVDLLSLKTGIVSGASTVRKVALEEFKEKIRGVRTFYEEFFEESAATMQRVIDLENAPRPSEQIQAWVDDLKRRVEKLRAELQALQGGTGGPGAGPGGLSGLGRDPTFLQVPSLRRLLDSAGGLVSPKITKGKPATVDLQTRMATLLMTCSAG